MSFVLLCFFLTACRVDYAESAADSGPPDGGADGDLDGDVDGDLDGDQDGDVDGDGEPPCDLDHATADCVDGECVIFDCEDNWGDCNSDYRPRPR